MFPPIFQVAAADTGVQAVLGDNPVRFWPFGEGEPDPQLPYAVWQTAFGNPLNYVNQRPDGDQFGIQIDVYAKQASDARDAAQAIRDAIEGVAHVTQYNGEFRDPVTRNYRYSFTADFIVNR